MKNVVVEVPSIREPIQASPGFAKKCLSDYKLDILGLCGFGCRYCSSNEGNYLRIHRREFAEQTLAQIGERLLPSEAPQLMFAWPDVLEKLESQLRRKPQNWGAGKTLVFSMLTDGFSPELVRRGITERALQLVLDRTAFRVRILTKNAIVGSEHWIRFFAAHRDRFVVGLSIGTLDNRWAQQVEIGASLPSARLRALHALQDEGIATYGMLCPVFPDLLDSNQLEVLIASIRPTLVEHVWSEPFNDRHNWRIVRDGYKAGSFGYEWFTNVYEEGRTGEWSRYATQLYLTLRSLAERDGWLHKLRYLLYERNITAFDAELFGAFEGVLLQSVPGEDGSSRNAAIGASGRSARA